MDLDGHDAPGWYGKLSSLGDFAQRRMAPAWVQAVDAWLAAGVAASRAQLGTRWQSLYLTAPLCRFAWAPGVIDSRWWFGVVMPSCDNVGRYYPLVVAQARRAAPADHAGLAHLQRWWLHVASAALQTLQDGASVDGFEAHLHAAPRWPHADWTMTPAPRRGGVLDRYVTPPGGPQPTWQRGVALHDALTRYAGCSLWWPLDEDDPQGAMVTVRGLPDAERFGELLING